MIQTAMAEFSKLSSFNVSKNISMARTLKIQTSPSHTFRSRPTLKDAQCLIRNRSAGKIYERSIYKRTFSSELT